MEWIVEYWNVDVNRPFWIRSDAESWDKAQVKNVLRVYVQWMDTEPYGSLNQKYTHILAGYDYYFLHVYNENKFCFGGWNDDPQLPGTMYVWDTGDIKEDYVILSKPSDVSNKEVKEGVWLVEPYASMMGFSNENIHRAFEGPFDIDLTGEVTICIPVENCINTIASVLLGLASQSAKLKILVYVLPSINGTEEFIQALRPEDTGHRIQLQIVRGPVLPDTAEKIAIIRASICQLVSTPYLFFLDSDVLLRDGHIAKAVEFMNLHTDIGMAGIPYEACNITPNHIKMGATIFRTFLAQQIKWYQPGDCECIAARKSIEMMQYKAEFIGLPNAIYLKSKNGVNNG